METKNILSQDSFVEVALYMRLAQQIAKTLGLKYKDANVLLEIIREVYQVEICREKIKAIETMVSQGQAKGGCCGGRAESIPDEDAWEVTDE